MTSFTRDPGTAKLGKEILPFEVGYLPKFFQKKATIELYDTPDRRAQSVQRLRELIKSDKYLRNIEFSEDFLIMFLLPRKFNVSRAFTQLQNYINLKRNYSYMFNDFQFEVSVKPMMYKMGTMLPWRCQDGCTIFLIQIGNLNFDKFPMDEAQKVCVVYLMQALREPMTQVNGIKVILDMKCDFPMKLIMQLSPKILYLLYHGTQECAPGRFKAFHIVNQSLFSKVTLFIMKSFASAKVKERIHLHDTPESLLDFFPAAVLPVQYGGELEDYSMTEWLQKVMTPEALKHITLETTNN